MASSDPAYYNPNFYQKIRRYFNNRMIQTGRPPTKEEMQAMMESALNQAEVARDQSEVRRQTQEQIDMQKKAQKMANIQSGINAVGSAASLYGGGKMMGWWGGASKAVPASTTAASTGLSGASSLSPVTATGSSASTGAASPWMGAMKVAGPIAAGIALNLSFADKNKSKPLFEGQRATDVRQGDIWTEPWLETLVGDKGVTMGRKAGAAFKNEDWKSLAARAPAAGLHWTNPLHSTMYEWTKSKFGKTAASLLVPDFGITDYITGAFEDDDSTAGKILDPLDIF